MKSSRRRLHEMLFESSDCFIELGRIRKGSHGWLFVFREELEKWLLSAVDPFNLIYRDPKGLRTLYGIYRALPFPEGNMTGPEFAQLSELVGAPCPRATPMLIYPYIRTDARDHCNAYFSKQQRKQSI